MIPPPRAEVKLTTPNPITVRGVFYVLAIVTILGASLQHIFQRVIWTAFGVMFLVAADKIKDVERAKQKERDLTEIRMKKEMLEGWEASLEGRYSFTMEQIAKASHAPLQQVSTYVRDASPTRAAELRLVNEDDER